MKNRSTFCVCFVSTAKWLIRWESTREKKCEKAVKIGSKSQWIAMHQHHNDMVVVWNRRSFAAIKATIYNCLFRLWCVLKSGYVFTALSVYTFVMKCLFSLFTSSIVSRTLWYESVFVLYLIIGWIKTFRSSFFLHKMTEWTQKKLTWIKVGQSFFFGCEFGFFIFFFWIRVTNCQRPTRFVDGINQLFG